MAECFVGNVGFKAHRDWKCLQWHLKKIIAAFFAKFAKNWKNLFSVIAFLVSWLPPKTLLLASGGNDFTNLIRFSFFCIMMLSLTQKTICNFDLKTDMSSKNSESKLWPNAIVSSSRKVKKWPSDLKPLNPFTLCQHIYYLLKTNK